MTGTPAPPLLGSAAAFERRARARLGFDLPPDLFDSAGTSIPGDQYGDGQPPVLEGPPRAAAVLVPVVERAEAPTVLLTLRNAGLRSHSGQIAFPGGKMDEGDASPLDAALREAEEEIGLDRARVTPLGYLDPYLTGTGYLIVPVVAVVREPFRLTVNPDEVQEAFEVPLAFLMEEGNHGRGSREWNGRTRHFYVMPYEERRIWGITANILRSLYERLYRP